jgi:transaldolase/transaldolase/glucose-6-phosphate isomerase
MKQTRVNDIHRFGQSIWLDFFDRSLMDSGRLESHIEIDGVTGITANPSIFEKAILNSSDYNADIIEFSKVARSNEQIFYRLAVKDIRRAADTLKTVYDKTDGNDGFISIEVSPRLAYDTQGTINQARELWEAIDRRNVMIKIPGTKEGLPAIRKCISEGININVTLLFGLHRYLEVTNAYIAGLEQRVEVDQSIDQISSVASFFLSRIDVLIDPLLDAKGLTKLKGEVSIASARKAYEIYKQVFNTERFRNLEVKGAKRQRVLWASTSSKDPSFRDVRYVEALIGPQTINTIPLETLEAFNDHGLAESRLEDELDKATNVLVQLKEKGIDINTITQKLEEEGIKKFNKAYDNLLEAIGKRKQVS